MRLCPAGERNQLAALSSYWQVFPLLMMIAALLTIVMGLHRVQLKAYDTRAVALTGLHAILMAMSTAILDDLANFGTPLSTFINFALVYLLFGVGSRVILLRVLLAIYRAGHDQLRIVIYGAGQTGRQLAAALKTDEKVFPVAFIDDNRLLHGTVLHGIGCIRRSRSAT